MNQMMKLGTLEMIIWLKTLQTKKSAVWTVDYLDALGELRNMKTVLDDGAAENFNEFELV